MSWIQEYELPFKSTPYKFNLHGLCDLQLGSESTALGIIRSRIKEILKDPTDCGVIIPGDIEDEDRPSTRIKRHSTFADRPEVWHRDARKHMNWLDDKVIPMLLPLHRDTKYGIMGVLAGHHWTQLSPVLNSVQYICSELKRLTGKEAPYLGEMTAMLVMTFRGNNQSRRIVGYVAHGEGGGQTKAASLNKIERMFQGVDADFYIRAHDCQRVASMTDRLYPRESRGGNPEILHKTVAYLNLGSATKGYDISKGAPSYIEQKMLRPVTMGWGSIQFILRKALDDEDRSCGLKCDMRITV